MKKLIRSLTWYVFTLFLFVTAVKEMRAGAIAAPKIAPNAGSCVRWYIKQTICNGSPLIPKNCIDNYVETTLPNTGVCFAPVQNQNQPTGAKCPDTGTLTSDVGLIQNLAEPNYYYQVLTCTW